MPFSTAIFHQNPSSVLIYRLGIIYDALGIYILYSHLSATTRGFASRFRHALRSTRTGGDGHDRGEVDRAGNLFALSFGDFARPEFRNGSFRARGPFVHPILAGTIAASCLPMALCLWRDNRKLALAGLAAAAAIVFSSGSSGPVMTTLAILLAVALWTQRQYLRAIRWFTLILILALALAMKAPVYYLIARIDITGGSACVSPRRFD